jgi:hypothetical protein
MSRYIDADKVMLAVTRGLNDFNWNSDNCRAFSIEQRIKEIPTADVRENVHGKWLTRENSNVHYCQECGWALMDAEGGVPPYMGIDFNRLNPERWNVFVGWIDELMNFCPNCGADMRGEKDESL